MTCVSSPCHLLCNGLPHSPSTRQHQPHCTCVRNHIDDTSRPHRERNNQLRKGFACSSRRSCIPQGTICMSCVSLPCRPMCTNRPCMSSTVPPRAASACCRRHTRGTATRRHRRNNPANNAFALSYHRTSNPWGRHGTCDLRSGSVWGCTSRNG